MKKLHCLLFIASLFLINKLNAQIIETHNFGSTGTYYHIYNWGKTWDFTAENTMHVDNINVKSVLASDGGTFFIEIYIKGSLVAEWDQYVHNTTFDDYYHSKQVNIELEKGDNIQYKIWGGDPWNQDPMGGIMGINYVKLSGEGINYDLHFSSLNQMNEARFGIGYTSDGSNLYSLGGKTDIFPYKSTTVERYNLSNESWEIFTTDMIPRGYCSAEFIGSQNSIYVFNGDTYSDNTYTDTIEIINVQSGIVDYNTSNPYPVEYGGSAVWNDKIYVFGGSNSAGFSNRLYEYDPTANSWMRLPDMPEAKQTNGEVVKGILYVIGGYNGSVSKRIDAFDIQSSSWTSLGELPVGISAHSMTTSGNNIWIVGSYNDIHMVAIYNTETKEFTQLNTDIIGRRHCGICIKGSDLLVYGGNQPTGSILKSMQTADISGYISSIDDYVDSKGMLISCFPNPLSTSTTISYTLNKPANIRFTVYNVQSKIVFTMQEKQDKGEQRIQWNAEGLPAGMYYFRIEAGEMAGSGKMVKMGPK